MTLEEALDTLGRSPEVIRVQMQELGVRGDGGTATECPIARYLSKRVDLPIGVLAVGNGTVRNRVGSDPAVALPMGVRRFVWNMDDGNYPELRQ